MQHGIGATAVIPVQDPTSKPVLQETQPETRALAQEKEKTTQNKAISRYY